MKERFENKEDYEGEKIEKELIEKERGLRGREELKGRERL